MPRPCPDCQYPLSECICDDENAEGLYMIGAGDGLPHAASDLEILHVTREGRPASTVPDCADTPPGTRRP